MSDGPPPPIRKTTVRAKPWPASLGVELKKVGFDLCAPLSTKWYNDDIAEARHEARRWIGFRALFRDYMMLEFMSQEEFEQVLKFIPEIYAMGPADTDSVEGLDDELLDRCVDELTLTGTPDNDMDRIIEHLLEYKAIGVTQTCIELQ